METSSLAHYEPTWHFYRKLGYRQVAVVPDLYADGDDMIVFVKRMSEPTPTNVDLVSESVQAESGVDPTGTGAWA